MSAKPVSYRQAGVDRDAAEHLVRSIRGLAATTQGPEVRPSGAAYAALFAPPIHGLEQPLLAATCDGVGTKVLVAKACQQYRGLGQDLVAVNVNDLLPRAARPLFFLDYVAAGSLAGEAGQGPAVLEIVRGMADACRAVGCALLGGETAEMPDLYRPGDCDLVGFAVGIVEQAQVPRGDVVAGDVVLGLPAVGVHANGFSLVRRVLAQAAVPYDARLPELELPIGQELLRPTPLYVAPVLSLMARVKVRAAAHITGGGLLGRAAAMMPEGLRLVIDPATYARPAIFDLLARLGPVRPDELARTYNMGLGFLVVVRAAAVERALGSGHEGWRVVGRVEPGETGADLGYAAT